MSKQRHEDEGTPMGKRFSPTPERETVLNRFSSCYQRVSTNDKIKVVQTWVGITSTNVEIVCHTGLADIRVTDKGYFGAGIYSTLQADYARVYSEGSRFYGIPSIPPNPDGEHCLLLCWVAVGNVYPISKSDYGRNLPFSNFYHQDNGLALNPGFDSHCACVSRDDKLLQAAKFNNDTEKFDQDPKTLVDEIVVKESSQILPYCRVYYKK